MCGSVRSQRRGLKAKSAVTCLIKRKSLHCCGCWHHRQTSLIILSKCRFVQAISPLLFAYANLTDLIISFYISHTLIVIVKTDAWNQGQTVLTMPPCPTLSITNCRLSFPLHVLWGFVALHSHVAECHGTIISQQMCLPDTAWLGRGKEIIGPLPTEG